MAKQEINQVCYATLKFDEPWTLENYYKVGGYEPNTSKLAPEAEAVILTELSHLADRVVGDVFESFSKHPKDVNRRDEESKRPKSNSK